MINNTAFEQYQAHTATGASTKASLRTLLRRRFPIVAGSLLLAAIILWLLIQLFTFIYGDSGAAETSGGVSWNSALGAIGAIALAIIGYGVYKGRNDAKGAVLAANITGGFIWTCVFLAFASWLFSYMLWGDNASHRMTEMRNNTGHYVDQWLGLGDYASQDGLRVIYNGDVTITDNGSDVFLGKGTVRIFNRGSRCLDTAPTTKFVSTPLPDGNGFETNEKDTGNLIYRLTWSADYKVTTLEIAPGRTERISTRSITCS
ncbi:hypothetical protein KC722_01480 [Candidatus Kaiserbacteria bacterium]|nr:hypothetical protein [Candidatus Kaiserbacteria bacterium]